MPLTPTSAATSYCTVPEFLAFYDAHFVGDFLKDNDERVPPSALATNPNLLAILNWASGQVEAACLAGNRYKPEDLQALTGVSSEFLKGIVADLAITRVKLRRGYSLSPQDDAAYKNAMESLDRMRKGEQIFGFVQAAEAGTPKNVHYTVDVINRKQNLVSAAGRRFFGQRNNPNDFAV